MGRQLGRRCAVHISRDEWARLFYQVLHRSDGVSTLAFHQKRFARDRNGRKFLSAKIGKLTQEARDHGDFGLKFSIGSAQ